jgi:hypothetical protein
VLKQGFQFRPPLFQPLRLGNDWLAIGHDQRIGKTGFGGQSGGLGKRTRDGVHGAAGITKNYGGKPGAKKRAFHPSPAAPVVITHDPPNIAISRRKQI